MKKTKINNFKTIVTAMLVLSISVLMSCGNDETSTPAPVASYTVELTGTVAKFTNTSTDADSYSWDFGDGSTSTEESPEHDFTKFAAYVVKLTVTNKTGSDDISAALELSPKITIDGTMSDWDVIPVLSTRHADSSGVVLKIKATSDLTNIYFYMEGTDAIHGFVQLYLNADNDATTGYSPLDHPNSGADFELDAGPYGGSDIVELWPWVDITGNEERREWSFDGTVIDNASIYIKPVKSGNAIEFALVRSEIPGLAGTISFALGDVLRNPVESLDWIEHGHLPNPTEDYLELELFK